jgi:hypothetical protein
MMSPPERVELRTLLMKFHGQYYNSEAMNEIMTEIMEWVDELLLSGEHAQSHAKNKL